MVEQPLNVALDEGAIFHWIIVKINSARSKRGALQEESIPHWIAFMAKFEGTQIELRHICPMSFLPDRIARDEETYSLAHTPLLETIVIKKKNPARDK